MDHGLLRWWAPDELDEDRRAVRDAIVDGPRAGRSPGTWPVVAPDGRLNGPFNAMVAAGPVGMGVQRLGAAIRYESALPGRLRELAILELALLRDSPIEWLGHVGPARAAGWTDEDLAAVREGREPSGFGVEERLVVAAVRHLVADRTLSEDMAAEVLARFGERGFLEILYCVGYYDMLALVMAASRTPLPAGWTAP